MHIRQISPLVGLAAALCACSGALVGRRTDPRVPVAASVSGAPGVANGPVAVPAAPADPPAYATQPAPVAARDPRDLQVEIMTEAVAALRHELARSYGNSQKLAEEGERLRALVTSLRTELGKEKRENTVLKRRLEALKRRLEEITTPPPEATSPESAAPELSPGASLHAPAEPEKQSNRPEASTTRAAPPEGERLPRQAEDAGIADRRESRPAASGIESE